MGMVVKGEPRVRTRIAQASEANLSLTTKTFTKTIIVVGSYCETLYRIYRQPTNKMVLVVQGVAAWDLKDIGFIC